MHECPDCGMICDCDMEDTWWSDPLPFECYHDCDEEDWYDDDYDEYEDDIDATH